MNGSVTGKPTIYWAQCPSSGHTQAEEHPPVPLEARHTGGPPKLATLLDPQKEKTLRPPPFLANFRAHNAHALLPSQP